MCSRKHGTHLIAVSHKKFPGGKPSGNNLHDDLCFRVDDLFLVIRAACLAYSVRNHQRAAFAAFYQCRSAHFPVRSSSVSSSLGRFILRTNDRLYRPFQALSTKICLKCQGIKLIVIFDTAVVLTSGFPYPSFPCATVYSTKHVRSAAPFALCI